MKKRALNIKIERTTEGYWASAEYKGVVASFGKTIQELDENLDEALLLHLDLKTIRELKAKYQIKREYILDWYNFDERQPEELEPLVVLDSNNELHKVYLHDYNWVHLKKKTPLIIEVKKWLYYNK